MPPSATHLPRAGVTAQGPSVPGEILIKFKDGSLNWLAGAPQSAGAQKLAALAPLSFRKLNGALGVTALEPVFRNFAADQARAKADLRLLARQRRAPAGAAAPRLDAIFKLKLALPPGPAFERALAAYRRDPNIEYAEPNTIYSVSLAPNDPLYAKQWPLNNTGQLYPASGSYTAPPGKADADLDAPEAWAKTTGSASVIVAVIDTGADLNHRDLKANLWVNAAEKAGKPGVDDDKNGYVDDLYGYDFCSLSHTPGPTPADDFGHGTHAAGIIAAKGNNGLDIAGVSWNAKVMPLKFMNNQGKGNVEDAAKAFAYATAKGADVISCSWGDYNDSPTLRQAIQYATSRGVVVVAAAGNAHYSGTYYPAADPGVISVGATDSRDQRADFSNYGCWVDLAAPGVDILSLRAAGTSMGTVQDAYTTVASGTSMACPQVAGVAALVLGLRPTLSCDQMLSLLKMTSDPLQTTHYLGQGRVNAQKAVSETGNPPLCQLNMDGVLAYQGRIGGKIDLTGTAAGGDFTSYTLYYGAGEDPASWSRLVSSTTAVTSGVLYRQFNTVALADGLYTVRLDVGEKKGRKVSDRRTIQVCNVFSTSPFANDILRPGGVIDLRLSGTESYIADALDWGLGAQPASWSSQGLTRVNGPGDLVGRWNTAFIKSNGFYTLRLRCHSASGSREVYIRSLYFDTRLKPGWPQYVPLTADQGSNYWPGMYVAHGDLDGDGQEELVCVESASHTGQVAVLRVYRADGRLAWQRDLDYYPVDPINYLPTNSYPVIGDLDGDGLPEIVVDVGNNGSYPYWYPVYAFRGDGRRMDGNWPLKLREGCGGKLLADVNHDGKLELVYRSNTMLSVIDPAGRVLSQKTIYRGSLMPPEPPEVAVGKFDDSGDLRILTVQGRDPQTSATYGNEDAVLLRADGSTLAGWPTKLYSYYLKNLVAVDMDQDGYDEVAFAAAPNELTGKGGGIYVIDRFGRTLPGWPVMSDLTQQQTLFITFAPGDVNGDGKPELVVSLNSSLIVFDLHGQKLPNYPNIRPSSTWSDGQPVIGDLDGDWRGDIVLVAGWLQWTAVLNGDFSYSGGIRALKGTGERWIDLNPESQFSNLWMDGVGHYQFLSLADIDHDGKVELIANSSADRAEDGVFQSKQRESIYVWELDVPYQPSTMQWPTWHHDSQFTGRYSVPKNGVRQPWTRYP